MKTTQKGFVIPLLIGIIAILVAGGGAYVYTHKEEATIVSSQPMDESLVSSSSIDMIDYGYAGNDLRQISDITIKSSNAKKNNEIFIETQKYQKRLTKDQSFAMSNKAIDRKVEDIDTSSYSYTRVFGYQFKTPWGEGAESEKTKKSSTMKQIEFSNGKKIILICGKTTPRYEFTHGDPITNDPYPKEDVDQMLKVLGKKADSGFEYFDFLLSISVDDILNSKTLDEALGISKLLTLKSTQDFTRQAYRINLSNVKGFQFGVPSSSSSLKVKIFSNDGSQCDLLANESNNITQVDLDVIWSTFSVITK